MKNTLLAFVLLVCFSSFSGIKSKNELNWLDWNTGYPMAKKQNKIIVLDAYTDWCGWCKKMDRDTYSNEEVIKTLTKNFVIIKFNPEITEVVYDLDGEKISGRELYIQLTQGKSTGFPSTYFIQPNKKQIQVVAGYIKADEFVKILEQVKNM
jgi:thioredoxin-related protein